MTDEKLLPSQPEISFSDVVRSVVRSLAEAQATADVAALEQLLKLGLEQERAGPFKLKTIEIQTERVDEDGKLGKRTLSAPLIALSPPSHLQIKSAEISFDFKVISSKFKDDRAVLKDSTDKKAQSLDFFGYIVHKSDQDLQKSPVERASNGITVKLNIESPPISEKFGALIDQIGNSFLSKEEAPRNKRGSP